MAKSHDIDVIVDHATLASLRSRHRLTASKHVGGRRYQAVIEGVEVDIYPVYQSKLGGRLQVPVELLNTPDAADWWNQSAVSRGAVRRQDGGPP